MTFQDVARTLSDVLGRPIRWEPVGEPGYLRRRGLPWPAVLVQAYLHVGLHFEQAEAVDPTLARLLGRPSRDLRAYVAGHREIWT